MDREGQALTPDVALSALRWWTDAGVDTLVDEAPRDWLRRSSKPSVTEPRAREPDALPDQLDLFHEHLASSERLSFASPKAPRLLPAGNPAAGLMVITDMPASEDFGSGALISGEAGRLFDRMMAAIGRDRSSIYLAALSCLRSPDGLLGGESAQQCAALARHHVGLVAPKAVLLLGDACAKALLGLSVAQARGRSHAISTYGGDIRVVTTFHPTALLYQPVFKAAAWADLRLLMKELEA